MEQAKAQDEAIHADNPDNATAQDGNEQKLVPEFSKFYKILVKSSALIGRDQQMDDSFLYVKHVMYKKNAVLSESTLTYENKSFIFVGQNYAIHFFTDSNKL